MLGSWVRAPGGSQKSLAFLQGFFVLPLNVPLSCAGGYIFPFRAVNDTPFPRRKLPRRIPGAFGQEFPRRRLHFSIPGGKRYLIPAQNCATEDSGRVWTRIPAQAATFFHSRREKIPHSRAERCHGTFRADWALFSRADGYNFLFRAEKDTPSRAEGCHGGFRAGLAKNSRPGGYIFPFRARKDTPFLRRTVPRNIPSGLGTVFPRRLLHLSFPRQKRYPIPAQNGATKDSGRVWPRIPAQAATFFLSAQKMIPFSRAERCHGGFRAGLAKNYRAGGYIFPFQAGKDTSFPRRTVPRRIPGGMGTFFPRRESNMCRGEKFFLNFTFY